MLPEEATLLSKVLSEGNIDTIASSGFTVAGQKYAFTRADLDDEEAAPSIQGRCKEVIIYFVKKVHVLIMFFIFRRVYLEEV